MKYKHEIRTSNQVQDENWKNAGQIYKNYTEFKIKTSGPENTAASKAFQYKTLKIVIILSLHFLTLNEI